MKKLLVKLADAWKSCRLFHWIDRRISRHFQKRLTNDQFSILASNCIGGVISHRLGKQFLSPTVNMWMRQQDFVFFCLHLDYYLLQPLYFVPSEEPYPVAELRGTDQLWTIRLYFNHANTEEEARNDWERRKGRIRRGNLFLILYKLDGVSAEQLKQLEAVPCRGKVVLSAQPIPDIPWTVVIRPNPRAADPTNYLDKDVFGVRRFEKHFDYVNWLNTGSTRKKSDAR